MPNIMQNPQQYYRAPSPQWKQAMRLRAAKRSFSLVGLGAFLMLIVFQFGAGALILWMQISGVPEGSNKSLWLTMMIQTVMLYGIAMPIGVMAMRPLKPVPTQQFSLKPGEFFQYLLMCLPIIVVGGLLGSLVAGLVTHGQSENPIEAFVGQNILIDLIFTVLLAPIVEEWFFRQQVISRLRRYDEKTAILISAVIFGLGHGNIFQFFYAFGLGLVFGYIYVRTSRLIYSIGLHMIINALGSIGSSWIEQAEQVGTGFGTVASMLYVIAFVSGIIAGIVLLVKRCRTLVFYTTPEQLPSRSAVKVAFGNGGMITFLICAALLTWLTVFL
ncbi:CAAX amino terminal protease family protein [Bifidobacterium dolichotidis]|uniref:CAAX amino terminal protease family protein n=1 Tax=Bifidobacterium dolichotidis TaxID=2306976 RepID=A0A430FQL3_9BIFI|nr:CPBP family intramembrane glutamic endopeptidase [Bifidobacterium dolichotidis]RSX55120.1 CAAX amino terminal protease family protein [Bifidobacterium dolichotidis]